MAHTSGDSEDQFDYLFKIVLIGDAGVGKTCIVQRFKTGNFLERHGSTIGVDFTMKTLNIDGKRVKVGLTTRVNKYFLFIAYKGRLHIVLIR